MNNNDKDFEAIFFDFDDVLAESLGIKTRAFESLFSSHGEEIVKKVVNHHLNNGAISRQAKIEYYHKEFLGNSLTKKKVNDLANEFSKLVVNEVIKADWVKGAKGFLKRNYKEIDLYVISGTPQKELEIIIEKRHMSKFFKGVFGTPKTKTELINLIISKNDYSRDKVLFIGDALSDLTAALETGVNFLGRVRKDMENHFPKEVKIINDFNDHFF